AWHLPSYTFRLTSNHLIRSKVQLSSEWIAMGGLVAPTPSSIGFIELRSFFDVNVRTAYLVTDSASIWVHVNNLVGRTYERYVGYPVRGLAFKLGFKYRF
ncbi:MAG: hypothetical protein AAFY41_17160, partial [Bacteroidota bacterium]